MGGEFDTKIIIYDFFIEQRFKHLKIYIKNVLTISFSITLL